MKRIYISGPMAGKPDLNSKEFLLAECNLNFEEQFDLVVNPSRLAGIYEWNKETDLCVIARVLLKALTLCTHIYMLRGWEQSKGATAEHAVAKWIGLEIIYQGEAE